MSDLPSFRASSYEYARAVIAERYGGITGTCNDGSFTLKDRPGTYKVVSREKQEFIQGGGLPGISLPVTWELEPQPERRLA